MENTDKAAGPPPSGLASMEERVRAFLGRHKGSLALGLLGLVFMAYRTQGQICEEHQYDFDTCLLAECSVKFRNAMDAVESNDRFGTFDSRAREMRFCVDRCRACERERPTPAYPRAVTVVIGVVVAGFAVARFRREGAEAAA
jgi:hypothetical protein